MNGRLGLNSFQTSGNSPGRTRCRVGLLGFSPVGAALAARLTGPGAPSTLELTHICDRRAKDKHARQPQGARYDTLVWTEHFDDLLTSDVEIIADTMPRGEPVVDYLRAALLTGKSVVTAGAQVIAHHGPSLLSLAERQGRQVRFEAAVGGAMPIVRVIDESLAGDRVIELEAILNSATNLVLSRMDDTGCGIDSAIADACAAGHAGTDPTADLDGSDAAAKLAILCALAFHVRVLPSQIDVRSASRVSDAAFRKARLAQSTIRQIAYASFEPERRVLTAWVAPKAVPQGSVFGRTSGPGNAAAIVTAHAGTITTSGVGGGGEATAAALIGDLVAIARDRAAIVPAPVLTDPADIRGLADSTIAEAV